MEVFRTSVSCILAGTCLCLVRFLFRSTNQCRMTSENMALMYCICGDVGMVVSLNLTKIESIYILRFQLLILSNLFHCSVSELSEPSDIATVIRLWMLKDTDTDMVSMSDVHVNNMANSVLMQKVSGGGGIVVLLDFIANHHFGTWFNVIENNGNNCHDIWRRSIHDGCISQKHVRNLANECLWFPSWRFFFCKNVKS